MRFSQLKRQIEALQSQATEAKAREAAGVAARIKEAIATYSLTREDLFGGKAAKTSKVSKSKTPAKQRQTGPKFADGKGGTWGGMGKRPQWLRDALAAGKKLEDFAVVAGTATESALEAPAEIKVAKVALKKKVKSKFKAGKRSVKFKDEAGNVWSGRGPRPVWFKDALAAQLAFNAGDDVISAGDDFLNSGISF